MANNNNTKFSFVSDLNPKGAKRKPYALSLAELQEQLELAWDEEVGDGAPPHIHEQITGKCIPYLDLDCLREGADRLSLIATVRRALAQALPPTAQVVLADRSGLSAKHGKQKLSLRAYVRGVGHFSCPPACGAWMGANLKPLLGTEWEDTLDQGAYKTRQNMGLVYNTKMGDDRVLELLDDANERLSWEAEGQVIAHTIIQNVEGEEHTCLDPEGWEASVAEPYVVVDGGGGDDNGIGRVLTAAKSVMPGLEIRQVLESGDCQVVEFLKSYDDCAICQRTHTGNRAYAVLSGQRAVLKCHDQDAKDKHLLLFDDSIRDMLPGGQGDAEESDAEESDAEAEVEVEAEVSVDDLLELKLLRGDHTDEDYAELFMAKYPDQFILHDNSVYQFKQHTWRECANDDVLYNFLGTSVYSELRRVLDATYRDIEDAEKHAKIAKRLTILRNRKTRAGIVASIKAKIHVSEEPFDLKPTLVGFNNGVYDLEAHEFREGKWDDYVSKSVGYDYAEVSDEQTAELMGFIDKIMPHEDERDCLLRGLASGLHGKTLQNLFILTGEGGNGKDTLVSKLYRDTVGRAYYEYSTTSILTEKKKGSLSQEVANLHKRRAVVWSEPAKQSVLQGSMIKELTGGDQVNACGLYSKNTTTLTMFSGFMLCNDIPRVDSVDGGLARRLLVVPFRSLFKTPEEIAKLSNTENVYEALSYYDSQPFRDAFRLTFFHVLSRYYLEFKRDGYLMKRIPKTISDLSAQYLADSDDFMGWFNDVFEGAEGEYVQLKDVWQHFKASDLYMNMSKAEKRVMNKKRMIENVMKKPALRSAFKDRHQAVLNGRQKNARNVLMGYRLKVEQVSDDDDDDDEN